MKYLSVCSGIEAATCAWHSLGWNPWAFSEIEPFPSAVLKHHYPNTPNLGDMTKFKDWPDATFDLLVGGTPCQSFSVAGLRKGLDDPRGNLMLTFGAIAAKYRPRWLVWENVPGVLSSNEGRDFGTFLGMLGQLGYGFAYRVLDAQYVRVDSHARAVPQRRRRVFVVGYLGNWRRAAAVLFERESLSGNLAPSRQARERVAGHASFGISPDCLDRSGEGAGGTAGERSGLGIDEEIAYSLRASRIGAVACMSNGQANAEVNSDISTMLTTLHEAPIIAHALRAEGFDASEDGTGRGTPLVIVAPPLTGNPYGDHASREGLLIAFDSKASGRNGFGIGEISPTLRAMGKSDSRQNAGGQVAVAFSENICGEVVESDVSRALQTSGGKPGQGYAAVRAGMHVRRLTPRECERLQGFPDDYTLIQIGKKGKVAPDGVRYRALGNSMAVNVIRWIGQRVEAVDSIEIVRVAA